MRNVIHTVSAVLLVFLAVSCSDTTAPDLTTPKKQAIAGYADLLYSMYSDAYSGAVKMQTAILNFTANPTTTTLLAAQNAWLLAREPYGQTEVARFYGGPIDGADGPEGLINAWPLDENYIDYVEGAPNAGIIGDTVNYPTITKELLSSLNEEGGEENISTGYHAIEFLLWGQDLTTPSTQLPGQRAATDYTIAPHAARRKAYLLAATELLLENLNFLVKSWDPASGGNYRTSFLALPPDSAITRIMQGMESLSGSELSGERMSVALGKGDQEDEHSCFSDNTHNDIRYNARGIANIWFGTYTKMDGTEVKFAGLEPAIRAANPTIANEVTADFNNTKNEIEKIHSPFDYEISVSNFQGNLRVNAAIQALRKEAVSIVKAAETLHIKLNVE